MEEINARMRAMLARAGLGAVPTPVVLVAAVVLVALVGVGVARWARPGGDEVGYVAAAGSDLASDDATSPSAGALGADAVSGSAEASVVVHVVGAVRHPGVVTLVAGSRVGDAVEAAGGLLGDAAEQAVNLAREVVDGEQIVVPTLDEYAAQGAAGRAEGGGANTGGAGTAAGGKVNLNTATASELDALPGVGPATADKIVAEREANGPFATPEDLMRVPGIGQKKFDALADLITVK